MSFQASHIRPTTDRVKESVFNILGQDLTGASVLDLFAGTGNLAIESVSRGAGPVVAVEKHPKSLQIIRRNLRELGIEDQVRVVKSDVFAYLKNFTSEPFDLILVDPPFTQKLGHEVMLTLAEAEVLAEQGNIVIEVAQKERLDEIYKNLRRIDLRNFGDKLVAFFSY